MSEQLILDLPQRPALGRDAFLVTYSNAEAVALIDGFAAHADPVHWLYGPSGCGKSHLAAVLAQTTDCLLLDAAQLADADGPRADAVLAGDRPAAALIIDRLDSLPAAAEEKLFHLLNFARNGGIKILLLSQAPAGRLRTGLPDLTSRLKAVPAVAMQTPDDRLMRGLLTKLFADRQVEVGGRVLDFLVLRADRDYAAMSALVARIDAAALAAQKPITVPLASAVLADAAPEQVR